MSYATNLWTRTFGWVPKFLIDKGADPRDTSKVGQLLAPYLSIYVREHNEKSSTPVEVDIGTAAKLEEMAATYAYTPIAQKPEKLLRLIEKKTFFPGQAVQFSAPLDYPAFHAIKPEEASYYLRALCKAGLVEAPGIEQLGPDVDSALQIDVTITLAGWSKLGATGTGSRSAFVAMSFDHSLDSAFSDGIEPAIRETGYESLRVDKVHHNEKICDRIVIEIRRSHFLIADVTMQRQGVYFEAGYAMALGLPVIWCCRRDDMSNIHFDTRQYNHIVWERPVDLRQQLLDRIRATVGANQ